MVVRTSELLDPIQPLGRLQSATGNRDERELIHRWLAAENPASLGSRGESRTDSEADPLIKQWLSEAAIQTSCSEH